MKAKDIQDLIDFIAQSGLDEVNIETESFKLSVKRHTHTPFPAPTLPNPMVMQSAAPIQPQPPIVEQRATPQAQPEVPKTESQYLTIKSPMIGTFYRSPNPESPAFVNVGDIVEVGQVVCIVEAMKLFNEIESEVSGRIVKVLLDNASPVEYDQPLFLVEP